MIQRQKRLLSAIWMLAALLCAAPGFAVQEPASGAPDDQPDAQVLLMRMADFLSTAKQFSFNMNAEYDVVQKSGQKIEFGESRKITLVRPDRMRVDTERSDGEKTVALFDGQELTVVSPGQKVYARVSKPGSVDDAIHFLVADLGLQLPLAMMYLTTLPVDLNTRVRSVAFVEQSTITDVPCAHLAARSGDVDFQVWIQSQGDPLPRRVVITYKKAPGQPQFRANLNGWDFSANPPEGSFSFSPPEGYQGIAFLAQLDVVKPQARKAKKGGKK
ncbi:MAG: DUF2092 domain-containing protein [Desulfobacteraceae bacterium]|nr:DUF2092 domain-containing protein [Desulfobacteraceae bacterium]